MKEGTVVVDGMSFDLLKGLEKPVEVEFRPLHVIRITYGSIMNRKLVVLGIQEGTTLDSISSETMVIVALNEDGGKPYRTKIAALNSYNHGHSKASSNAKVVADISMCLAASQLQQVAV